MSYRRRIDPVPRTIGVLLLLYVVFQIGTGAALLLQGLRLEAAIVLIVGPIVGALVADAVQLCFRVARTLHAVREGLRLERRPRRAPPARPAAPPPLVSAAPEPTSPPA